jgi:tRNA pseudouridine38-40 synthase
MKYFLYFSYKGTSYHGWQLQTNAYTVQYEVNRALSVLLRTQIGTYGCGRTDTGVHARYFVANFEAPTPIEDLKRFLYSVNNLLPKDIACFDIKPVNSEANARFSAYKRTYKYFISRVKNPFIHDYSIVISSPLDLKAMNVAAKKLIRTTDFTSFSKINPEITNHICQVSEAYWTEEQDGKVIVFTISSNRFLRSMVRLVVGALLNVGRGKLKPMDIKRILDAKDRSVFCETAPATGLFLWDVQYPETIV